MVGCGRTAGKHQLDQRHPDRDLERLRRHAVPNPLHRHEPRDELLAEPGRVRAGQRLVEMMMGVDESRQHDMARGVEGRVGANCRRSAAGDAFDDFSALDDDSALRAGGEDGERVLDP